MWMIPPKLGEIIGFAREIHAFPAAKGAISG
jgi:hypothetical protein